MDKKKYTYEQYDYSFLYNGKESSIIGMAKRVFARTIGFDLETVQPMDEPVGQLFWFDAIAPTDTTNDTTYEPMHTGGWEITLTPPTPVTVTETPVTSTATSGTYTQDEEKPQHHHHPSLYPHYTDIERYRKARSRAYFNNVKLRQRNTYIKYHGKKI